MILTWNDIVLKEGSVRRASLSVGENKYKKVAHGIYVDDGVFISELEQLFVRYPRATLSLQSALYFYELSDYVPDKYYLVTPYNAHVINNDKVVQKYMSESIMNIGRDRVETKYGYIYIFDKERMLIELFRLRTKFTREYFLEVVSSYRVLKAMGVVSLRKVAKYCNMIPRGTKILKEIQEMI